MSAIMEKREPLLSLLPETDPMQWDELTLRALEALVLKDLISQGAPDRILRIAHCIQQRAPRKERGTRGSARPSKAVEYSVVQGAIVAIGKAYDEAVKTIRMGTPSPSIHAVMKKLVTLMTRLQDELRESRPDH